MVYRKGDDPILVNNGFSRHRMVAVATMIMIVSVFIVAPTRQTQAATFVLSAHTWSYPDDYGQGIEYVYFIVSKPYDNPVNWSYQYYNGTESAGLEIPNNGSVSMRVAVWLNGTLTGYTYAEGRDLFTRVGIVFSIAGVTVASYENLTQGGGNQANDPMWLYYYEFLFNGDPQWYPPDFQAGQIYTAVLTYEIYT